VILEALARHYDRLAADPDSDIAPFGFSRQKIGFAVVLNPDGQLHAIQPLTDDSSGKPRAIELVVPGQAKPSGQGLNPCLLWDNPTYLLGYTPEGRDPDWVAQRFEAFRDRHLALQDEIKDDAFTVVCSFLKQWTPDTLADRPDAERETLDKPGFGVFQLRTQNAFVHDAPAVKAYWLSQLDGPSSSDEADINDAASATARCLVTGEPAPIARLHEPKIKGVAGGQSSGTTLVSFNERAYDSLGKSQGQNAPVSEKIAFAYATALNRLLADDQHRVQLGDTTCVFWAEATESEAPDALAEALGVWAAAAKKDTGQATRSKLADFLERFRRGQDPADTAALEHADAPFYILGLAPNAARLSVRFFHPCTCLLYTSPSPRD